MSDSDENELKLRLLGHGEIDADNPPLPTEELKMPFKEETRSKTVMR